MRPVVVRFPSFRRTSRSVLDRTIGTNAPIITTTTFGGRHRGRNLTDPIVSFRSLSSSSSSTTQRPPPPPPPLSPLIVSGASYLLPTLRLERGETPSLLSTRLRHFLGGASGSGSAAVREILRPRDRTVAPPTPSPTPPPSPTPSSTTKRRQQRTTAPVVLDTRAFQPDGSPHYVPPPKGWLSSIVNVLQEHGIEVIGLRTDVSPVPFRAGGGNAGRNEGKGEEGTPWEREASELGLPVLVARVGRTLGGTGGRSGRVGAGGDGVLRLEDVVRLLIRRGGGEGEGGAGEREEEEEDDDDDGATEPSSVAVGDGGDTTGVVRGTVDDGTVTSRSNTVVETTEETSGATTPPPLPHNGVPPPNSRFYYGSVRSGQQVSTTRPNQSLVVVGNVNSGGEVMAEGDVYVFGRLKGRALAGLALRKPAGDGDGGGGNGGGGGGGSGTGSGRIIASVFDPELVCIGESFTTVDSVEELGLEGEGSSGATVTVGRDGDLLFRGF